MDTIWFLFEIFVNIIYSVIFTDFITRYFGFKESVKHKRLWLVTIAIILFCVITLNNSYTLYDGFFAIAYILILFFYALIFLNGIVWEKIFVAILEIAVFMISAALTVFFVGIVFSANTDSLMIMEASLKRFTAVFFTFLLYIFILKLILLFKNKNKELFNKQWILLILIPLVSLVLVISIVELALNPEKQIFTLIYITISSICILGLNIIIYVIIAILNKTNKVNTEITLLNQAKLYEEKNANILKAMYEETKTLKHDIKQCIENIYVEVSNLPIDNEQSQIYMSNLKSYINDVHGKYAKIGYIVNTGNRSLDNVLTYKINAAKEHGITVLTDITYKIEGIEDIDLSILMGNLIDNAIEACLRIENLSKPITIKISRKKLYLSISVVNPIENSIMKTNPGFRTTKEDKKLHGLGVRSIKNITEKYNGLLNYRETEDGYIVAEVMLIEQEKALVK